MNAAPPPCNDRHRPWRRGKSRTIGIFFPNCRSWTVTGASAAAGPPGHVPRAGTGAGTEARCSPESSRRPKNLPVLAAFCPGPGRPEPAPPPPPLPPGFSAFHPTTPHPAGLRAPARPGFSPPASPHGRQRSRLPDRTGEQQLNTSFPSAYFCF